jgi:ketosteroid isomerase-like protein
MSDEQQIRTLIEAWARAAHEGDMDAVLADHAPDIVMLDVPLPQRGVRGLDAYRESWPGFFRWQASGAVFEIEELDITAGADVAFAYACCAAARRPPRDAGSACGSPRPRKTDGR